MTVLEIRNRVAVIKREASKEEDPSQAHVLEDLLYLDVLKAIAIDPARAQELAREALRANKLKFPRWFA